MTAKTEIVTDKAGNTLIQSPVLVKALLETVSVRAGAVNSKPSPHIIPGV
jgi:hypothetical protein